MPDSFALNSRRPQHQHFNRLQLLSSCWSSGLTIDKPVFRGLSFFKLFIFRQLVVPRSKFVVQVQCCDFKPTSHVMTQMNFITHYDNINIVKNTMQILIVLQGRNIYPTEKPRKGDNIILLRCFGI